MGFIGWNIPILSISPKNIVIFFLESNHYHLTFSSSFSFFHLDQWNCSCASSSTFNIRVTGKNDLISFSHFFIIRVNGKTLPKALRTQGIESLRTSLNSLRAINENLGQTSFWSCLVIGSNETAFDDLLTQEEVAWIQQIQQDDDWRTRQGNDRTGVW